MNELLTAIAGSLTFLPYTIRQAVCEYLTGITLGTENVVDAAEYVIAELDTEATNWDAIGNAHTGDPVRRAATTVHCALVDYVWQ